MSEEKKKNGEGIGGLLRIGPPGKFLPLLLLAAAGILLLWMGSGAADRVAAQTPTFDADAYRTTLEQELTALCAQVDGAGALSLCITLEGGERAVYAADRTAAGATDYVVRSGDGLLLSRDYPAVVGVGVVCEGGNDPRVAAAITALLSATLGIGSNRIAVCAGHP